MGGGVAYIAVRGTPSRGRGGVGVRRRHQQRGSRLTITYHSFMAVAACGVMIDNAILIVGAMALGPDFGPLAGICVAVGRRVGPPQCWRW